MMRPALLSLVLFAPIAAFADDGKVDDKIKRADALFAEGKALLDVDLHAACTKFDESYALNPHAIGTLLNVALCDEKLGKLASALDKFTRARDMATEAGLDAHRTAAETHVKDLTPRIPHVQIAFVELRPDMTIVIDGKAYPQDNLKKLAVDPGEHVLVVSAPGYEPYETTFAIAEGEYHDVAVPRLEKAVTVRSSRRTLGYILGGSGAALGAGAIVVSLVARSRYNDAGCSDGTCPSVDALDKANSARSLGTVGTVVGILGGAALVTGAVLWWTARDARVERPAPALTVVPQIAPDGAGITAVGRF